MSWKHLRFREYDEDKPPLKVLELRGIRRVKIIFVRHKGRSFTWTCNVRIQCLRGSALKLSQPTYLCPGFDLHHGEKDAYECHSTTKNFHHKRLKYGKCINCQMAFRIFKHFSG
jgi:hypothetical protein